MRRLLVGGFGVALTACALFRNPDAPRFFDPEPAARAFAPSDPAGTSTVSSVAFLGPISRVYCTLQDGSVISAQMASAQARGFAPGAPVSVGVEPTGVLVVEGGNAA